MLQQYRFVVELFIARGPVMYDTAVLILNQYEMSAAAAAASSIATRRMGVRDKTERGRRPWGAVGIDRNLGFGVQIEPAW